MFISLQNNDGDDDNNDWLITVVDDWLWLIIVIDDLDDSLIALIDAHVMMIMDDDWGWIDCWGLNDKDWMMIMIDDDWSWWGW